MFNRIRALIDNRRKRAERALEHARLQSLITDALKRLRTARRHYESLLASITWTEETDKRIKLAYTELQVAEGNYTYLLEEARREGVLSSWEVLAV